MSVQFGRWDPNSSELPFEDHDRLDAILARYGDDSRSTYSAPGIQILYRAFHTTKESRKETQPHKTPSGAILTWDGRLDNRDELIRRLGNNIAPDSSDVEIVAMAFDRWGLESFARLIGDWALSIWQPRDNTLLLAKDFVGTRPLYYTLCNKRIYWSTLIEPLLLTSGKPLEIEEEYIAGWLGSAPRVNLTPFRGICSAPPASFVSLTRTKIDTTIYWNFDRTQSVRYRDDRQYEQHFREALNQSVRRRLRADTPVLIELSGGIDSSSIVCSADLLMQQGLADTPRIDTVSCYDDDEPNWNERPYFTEVERQRRRTGGHINVGSNRSPWPQFRRDRFAPSPASSGAPTAADQEFFACLTAGQNRVLLSGVGGDEFTGGVPTPIPEIADLFVSMRASELVHQLKVWALARRVPWFHVLRDTLRCFLPSSSQMEPSLPWMDAGFAERQRVALGGYPQRLKFGYSRPSFQANIATLDALRRQLSCSGPAAEPVYERRYPYLDRDLLAFLFAIPRNQLIRPGERRSLMRRALSGIVPAEILNRKRKAFVARAPLLRLSADGEALRAITQHMRADVLGIIKEEAFRQSLEGLQTGHPVPLIPVLRTIAIECWLRHLEDLGYLGHLRPIRSEDAVRDMDPGGNAVGVVAP